MEPLAATFINGELWTREARPVFLPQVAPAAAWRFKLNQPLTNIQGHARLVMTPRRVSPLVQWEAIAEDSKVTYEVASALNTQREAEQALRDFDAQVMDDGLEGVGMLA